MPFVLAFLGGIALRALEFLTKYIGKRLAGLLVSGAGVLILSGLYFAVGYGIIHALLSFTPTFIDDAFALALPDHTNVMTCISAVIAIRTARWVYVKNFGLIMSNKAT